MRTHVHGTNTTRLSCWQYVNLTLYARHQKCDVSMTTHDVTCEQWRQRCYDNRQQAFLLLSSLMDCTSCTLTGGERQTFSLSVCIGYSSCEVGCSDWQLPSSLGGLAWWSRLRAPCLLNDVEWDARTEARSAATPVAKAGLGGTVNHAVYVRPTQLTNILLECRADTMS